MNISDFYRSMYVDASSYDNLRSIASLADGLKNSGRKVLYTVLDKNIKSEVKVSRLKSTVSEHTEYLHGEDNLSDVIVNMARSFAGSNNLPLLREEGNFGKRIINEASADRYIFTGAKPYLEDIFPKEDNPVLVEQYFEGSKIEPRYYVPVIPMLLVNGSVNAIGVGFMQNILPRPVSKIIKMVEDYIEGKNVKVPKPGWNGFTGKVEQGNNKKNWVVYGKFERINSTTIEITEIPVGYQLKCYVDILEQLKEDKIITSYKDLSDDGKFLFRVRVTRKFSSMEDEEIFKALKLKVTDAKKFGEKYVVMGENNRILIFDTPEEIFERYVKLRKDLYIKRKENLIQVTKEELEKLLSRYVFVKSVIDGSIVINNKKREQIINQIEKNQKIKKIDGGYDYLLRQALYNLTHEKLSELKEEITETRSLLDKYTNTSPEQFWKDDIEKLKKSLNANKALN